MPHPSAADLSSLPRPVAGPHVCLISLGCPKNLVDSEVMVGHLAREGMGLVADPSEADVVVVNTCGFIGTAREESVERILELAEHKRSGALSALVVTGCLVQLHKTQLAREIPEVDAFLPLSDYSGVPAVVRAVLGSGAVPAAGGVPKADDTDLGRSLLTPRHTAYLRLGEGCNHVCAFCAIPRIRGRLSSKPLEVLLAEAEALAALGVVELVLVAEDSTDWGQDLPGGRRLADLLQALGRVDGLRWVRVMYAHPATIDERLVRALVEVPNVLPYLDMPVQHGDEAVLRAMRRGTSPERIRTVVRLLRDAVPDITLRTTILVGFPGETERRFEKLLDMLAELRFDRLGCFTFSREDGTEGARLGGVKVARRVAEARQRRVMQLQAERVQATHRARLGVTTQVLLDERVADGEGGELLVGRTAGDAPDVDGRVLLQAAGAPHLQPGQFISARVTGVAGHDLLAEPA